MRRRLNLNFAPQWDFHRFGWKVASRRLHSLFHSDSGLPFYEWVDGEFKFDKTIQHQWAGILHNVIDYPEHPRYKGKLIYPLRTLIEKPFFLDSLKNCSKLFVLNTHVRDFLLDHQIETTALIHPGCKPTKMWERFDKLITAGQWLRNFESIKSVQTTKEKIILKVPFQDPYKSIDQNIKFIDYLPDKDYDELLATSVVFIDFYDVAASNTVIECIMGNIPLLVNRHKGLYDYLGADYPLYYDDFRHAACLLEKTQMAHDYLAAMDKSKFALKNFVEEFTKNIGFISSL